MSVFEDFKPALNYYSATLAAFATGILAPLVAVAIVLIGGPFVLALIVAVLCAVALFVVLVPRVPEEWVLYLRGKSRIAIVLWTLACLLVVAMTARLGVFMVDPHESKFSLAPPVKFMVEHTCLSGYLSAAALAELGTENLYILSHYKDPEKQSLMPEVAPLDRDFYAYPPQFLLLPAR